MIWFDILLLEIADFLDYYDRHLRFIDKVQHVNVLEFFFFVFIPILYNESILNDTNTHTRIAYKTHIDIMN